MTIGTAQLGTKVNGTSSLSSVPQPASAVAGTTLLAIILDHATSGTSAAPTGWTNRGAAAGAAGRLQVFSAVVGQGGLTGTSWSFSGLTTRSEGKIVGYDGVDPAILDVAVSARINASGTTGTTGITTGKNGCKVVAAFGALASGSTWSAEACATGPTLGELSDEANSTYCSIALADGNQAAAGATGASSATMGTAGANAALLIALRPATVTPGALLLTGVGA